MDMAMKPTTKIDPDTTDPTQPKDANPVSQHFGLRLKDAEDERAWKAYQKWRNGR